MEENVRTERRLVGRVPFEYKELETMTTLKPDSGFGQAGAKLDPRTGALMYDKHTDVTVKTRVAKDPAKRPVDYGGVRLSSDSMAMIHIREDEETLLSPIGKVKKHSAGGVVSVRNLSDTDRMWDIFVELRDENGMAILESNSVNATELEPRTKVNKEYRIDDFQPSIYLNEMISTHPDYPDSSILIKNRTSRVSFQLELKNLSSIPYENVTLRKMVPQNLTKVRFPDIRQENANLEEGSLVWRIPTLLPGASKVLKYEGDLFAQGLENVSTGPVNIEATGKDTITHFVITDFDAMCRNLYFIQADETDEPDRWLCNFLCENTSSFEVEVLKVDVRDSSLKNVYLNMLKPGINVPPKRRWESKPWIVEGKDRPSFIKTLLLNVVPGLSKEMYFKLNKEGSAFQVAGLELKKSFDKEIVVAGKVSELVATLEIDNVGSADIEQIVINDSLPIYMTPPSSFKVMCGTTHLTDNVKVNITPKEDGASVNQQLAFHITDLSQHGGALAKGEKLIITYTTQLIKPPASTKITAPVEVGGKTSLPGPVVYADDRGGVPTILTKQVLRKFSIGKSIEQGSGVGEYNIGIHYKNRGNQPVQNLIIKDILPKNFTGTEFTQEPKRKSMPDQGTMLVWSFPLLHEGDTKTVSYKIRGRGEYHPTEAQVFYNSDVM